MTSSAPSLTKISKEAIGRLVSELQKISHPAAKLFPLLPHDELDAFVADIAARGQLKPIILDQDGFIVDGRNRWLAIMLLGREPITEMREFTDASAATFVISSNIRRRHLTTSERAMLAARLRELAGEPGNFPVTQEEAAKAVGVDVRSVRDAETILRDQPELAAHVESKSLTVHGAKALNEVSPETREEALAKLNVGDRAGNKKIVRGARAAEAKKVSQATVTLPAVHASTFEELEVNYPRNLETHPVDRNQAELFRALFIKAMNRLPRLDS